MKLSIRLASAFFAVTVLALAGCGDDAEDEDSGAYNHYATSSLRIGANGEEANDLAFVDLDGKGDTSDNALGFRLAGFNSTFGFDTALGAAVTAGDIVLLHSVRADDIAGDDAVSWQVWIGDPQAAPRFDGTGTFTVAANAPRDAILQGTIAGGVFNGQAPRITFELAFGAGAPLRIKANAVHIRASVTGTTITDGRLAAAISTQELNDNVVPGLAAILDARIGADAGCRQALNECEEGNRAVREAFDKTPNDGTISTVEIRDSALIGVLFAADVDVLKANGELGQDGSNDSVSITLGFSGVNGTFTSPTE